MWKLLSLALTVILTGCGGGGDGVNANGSTRTDGQSVQPATNSQSVQLMQVVQSDLTEIGRYKNEIGASQVFNSAVADLNGDGLDDVVLSGWAVAQNTYVGNRSGFVNLKIFIQQDNGSLVDSTNDLIGQANSTIWGSQRILINDYDNDGRPDIAVLGFQDGPSAKSAPSVVFWNNGKSFSRSDLLDTLDAHAACSGDLNGDGLAELITGSSGGYKNTIYSNQGSRQFVRAHTLTQELISSAGACAVLKDQSTGNVAVVTTNLPLYPFFSAVAKVWDKDFNFVKVVELPGSEEPGNNIEILHDIINVIPIDINQDGNTDLILTDNGNFRLGYANGTMAVLINKGNFVFENATDTYLPNQDKKSFFNYYHTKLSVDGHSSIYLDHSGKASLWQIKNKSLIKYKEDVLNSLVDGFQYTNIYKTKKGFSLFLVKTIDYPYATFYSRPFIAKQ